MKDRKKRSALIYRKKDGTFGVEVRCDKPIPPDDVKVIEVLHSKEDETGEEFIHRVIRFTQEMEK